MDILVKKMNGYSINPSNNSFSILIIFSINSKSNFIYFKKKKKKYLLTILELGQKNIYVKVEVQQKNI